MSTNAIVEKLKESDQDFEWYPTTREILKPICADIKMEIGRDNGFSILDIGSGDGSALRMIEELVDLSEYSQVSKYAIEKSKILVDMLPSDVFVIGTDFHQQTLIDKQVDVIFCNPPYREYDHWMNRIVSEANAKYLYLVVPRRWRENKEIVKMVERRTDQSLEESTRVRSLGKFDFEDSEFRKARAKVEIVKIKMKLRGNWNSEIMTDPFDIWFEKHFTIDAQEKAPSFTANKSRAEKIHEMVKGQNLIERLEELYREDLDKLIGTYKSLEELDFSLFKELNVDLKQVREGLKMKIKGLKDLYWKELFDNMDSITSRLTSKSREKLLEKLTSHTSIDFSSENAYSVVIWAVKNANEYLDRQLTDVYFSLADKENIRLYKSNSHLVEDGWRYQKNEQHHFALDYRLIIQQWSVFSRNSWETYEYPNGMHNRTHDLLNDICTVGKNLGFDVSNNSRDLEWDPGKKNTFFLEDGSEFMEVRAYKKGTVHVKVNQLFMKKLNVEAGRLNGWVKSPKEAATEMGIPERDAASVFGSNKKLIPSSIKLISGAA